MTGGSLPAQTWHDIMVTAHQGVEVREIPGIGMGQKPPPQPTAAQPPIAAPKVLETKPGPPPVLTKRGADVLVRVEKLLDDAAQDRHRRTAADDRRAGRKPAVVDERARLPDRTMRRQERSERNSRPAQELIETPCG